MNLFQGIQTNNFFLIQDEKEIHHCIHVTRHKINDEILVTDFNGMIIKARIVKISKEEIQTEIISTYVEHKLSAKITIGISLAQSSDRFEWFLEKVTEIGVDKVVPLICKRTENTKNKLERWQKIILASSKQCLRPTLLTISEPIKFSEIFKTSQPEQRYICHCEDSTLPYIGKMYQPEKEVLVLIGPEGDFTNDEIEMAKSSKFKEASLGKERLRMETAGVVASVILKTISNIQ
ncbi:MAG: 16S rRNA (uracil(1498)-N(3))-methyltransferase [Saprospiraceae bacterium]|nr:16S rRNA (uracil(1498)-N(3))-methyltransferase [Saprospiraceae bacterium]